MYLQITLGYLTINKRKTITHFYINHNGNIGYILIRITLNVHNTTYSSIQTSYVHDIQAIYGF